MSTLRDTKSQEGISEQSASREPVVPHATTRTPDVENPRSTVEISLVGQGCGRENFLKKSTLVLRTLAFVFSFLSFLVMASSMHGEWFFFEGYRYCATTSFLAIIYTAAQIWSQIHQFWTGKDVISRWSRVVSLFGDQILAYLLLSALSAAAPISNLIREQSEASDNSFSDTSAASIAMAFFAFLSLALAALISGFKLAKQLNI